MSKLPSCPASNFFSVRTEADAAKPTDPGTASSSRQPPNSYKDTTAPTAMGPTPAKRNICAAGAKRGSSAIPRKAMPKTTSFSPKVCLKWKRVGWCQVYSDASRKDRNHMESLRTKTLQYISRDISGYLRKDGKLECQMRPSFDSSTLQNIQTPPAKCNFKLRLGWWRLLTLLVLISHLPLRREASWPLPSYPADSAAAQGRRHAQVHQGSARLSNCQHGVQAEMTNATLQLVPTQTSQLKVMQLDQIRNAQ